MFEKLSENLYIYFVKVIYSYHYRHGTGNILLKKEQGQVKHLKLFRKKIFAAF